MFEDRYVPRFCRLNWYWLGVLATGTAGAAVPLYGFYVGVWLKLRTGRSLAFYLYGALTLLTFAVWGASHVTSWRMLANVATILMLAIWSASFILRHELRSHYGPEFEISPWLTALFSVFYINYCLWAISDAPFPSRSL